MNQKHFEKFGVFKRLPAGKKFPLFVYSLPIYHRYKIIEDDVIVRILPSKHYIHIHTTPTKEIFWTIHLLPF